MRHGNGGKAVSLSRLNPEQTLEIREAVWDHRVNGVSFAQIPKLIRLQFNVEVGTSWCHQQARAELEFRHSESRAQFRQYELERLDRLQQAAQRILMQACEGEELLPDIRVVDPKTLLGALKELRAISESRRKLLGLDADQMLAERVADVEISAAEKDVEKLIESVRAYNEEVIAKARGGQDAS